MSKSIAVISSLSLSKSVCGISPTMPTLKLNMKFSAVAIIIDISDDGMIALSFLGYISINTITHTPIAIASKFSV